MDLFHINVTEMNLLNFNKEDLLTPTNDKKERDNVLLSEQSLAETLSRRANNNTVFDEPNKTLRGISIHDQGKNNNDDLCI